MQKNYREQLDNAALNFMGFWWAQWREVNTFQGTDALAVTASSR